MIAIDNQGTPPPAPMPGNFGSSGNPVLDEFNTAYSNASPPLKAAIEGAHTLAGVSPATTDKAIVPASQAAHESSAEVPANSGSMGMPGMVGVTPDLMSSVAENSPSAPLPMSRSMPAAEMPGFHVPSQAQSELMRVTGRGEDPSMGKSGAAQIKNPWLRGLATAGDVIASGLFPNFGQFIPGSSAHHNFQVVPQAERAVQNEQEEQKAADESRLQHAQSAEQESLPELHKTQTELAASKITNASDIAGAKQETANAKQALSEAEAERKRGESQQRIAAGLAEHGLKIDPQTKELIPITYAEMSETQKAAHDLKSAQAELTTARRDYVKAQKDGIPAAQELARKRVEAAQESASTAAGRLGLSRDEFNAQFLGTAPGGTQLAGGETDESGHPIGTKVAATNKPGAAAQGRASQAESVIEAGNNLKAEIDKHRRKIGNLASYWNQFANGSPIADPDAARLMSEIASYAALQPAMHGMRGGQVMKEFEKMVGGIPKNPDALKAAIDGISSTASVMAKQGQSHNSQHPTTGTSQTPSPAVRKYNPATGKLE